MEDRSRLGSKGDAAAASAAASYEEDELLLDAILALRLRMNGN